MKPTLRIALIEADQMIGELVHRWLREEGHVVVDCTWSVRFDATFDLVIADVANPRVAGPEIGRRLKGRHLVPVLLLSGRFLRGHGASTQLAEELGVNGVLPKPFTKQQLLAAVRQSLS